MKHYSPERKEAVLKKLATPHNLSKLELSQQEGTSVGALYNWRSQARLRGTPMACKPEEGNNPCYWTSNVVTSASMAWVNSC